MANTRFAYVRQFEQETTLMPDCWPLIRVDGRGFTGFSKVHDFRKPNEPLALGVINAAAAHVMAQFDDIVLAYGHSDEYRKILSSVVSAFSAAYCFHWSAFYPNRPLKTLPTFDGRIVLYPRFEHVVDYFSWRHADCHINNQYNICFWCLVGDGKSPDEAYKWLKHTQKGEKNEYIFKSRGINYNNLPRIFRKGTTLVRLADPETKDDTPRNDAQRDESLNNVEGSEISHSTEMPAPPKAGEADDVIAPIIAEEELLAISHKLEAICSAFRIGVLHCDNINDEFWKAVAPSYLDSGAQNTRDRISTLSPLSRENIALLNTGK
ncbi:tRNA-His guanylyltransferase, putative [Babesia bigemina]|uniref:tRNA(His) guanylyltransferase n=1 Tax=Babesia bigemina TaxID=5866 RepID=A0A061DAE0_BABBI|nr:tRNA-His guanylyltransferase, putative [Babesia bigemina]CDR95849.1 tRNA-His guanylyltransferase, putative [Babesia bigemina]|eukprot:XP_012768035.1 tRNA-His guanylyltransferase, putative [Babesia bigemina]